MALTAAANDRKAVAEEAVRQLEQRCSAADKRAERYVSIAAPLHVQLSFEWFHVTPAHPPSSQKNTRSVRRWY